MEFALLKFLKKTVTYLHLGQEKFPSNALRTGLNVDAGVVLSAI